MHSFVGRDDDELKTESFFYFKKFGYTEKATNLKKKIFHLKFDVRVASNFKWKIFSNFVAFSEYPNFTHILDLSVVLAFFDAKCTP